MSTLLWFTEFRCLYITKSVVLLFQYIFASNHSKYKCQDQVCPSSVRIEVIFFSASPNQWQSVSSPQYHCIAASYVITLLQQLADLCCVSHFAAVCTTVTLHCEVVLIIGNFHLIVLCESQGHVVCCSLFLLASKHCYYFIIIIIINIIIPFYTIVPPTDVFCNVF